MELDNRGEEEARPRPDLIAAIQSLEHKSGGFVVFWRGSLLALACLYTLAWAKPVILPIILAALLSFVLAPIVRGMARLRIPDYLAAGLVVVGLMGAIGYSVYRFAEPVTAWLDDAPRNLKQIGDVLHDVRGSVDKMSEAADQAGELAEMAPDDKTLQVSIKEPAWSEVLMNATYQIVIGGIIVFALLFFLLASRSLFLRKLVGIVPRFRQKRILVQIARSIETQASAYLLGFALNNLILGCAVAGTLYFLDLPHAAMWGTVAALFNFIPYVGALVTASALALAALSTFEDPLAAMIIPGAFLVLTTLEGTLMQPLILGRRLALNPVAIFVSILLWGWLWGIPGSLLAVPILAVTKIICDSVDGLDAIGELLGR